jgi:hypothetical protein
MGCFPSARPTSTFILRGPLLLFSSPPAQLLLLAPTHRVHRSASLSGDAHDADWWGPLVSSAVHLGTVALALFAAATERRLPRRGSRSSCLARTSLLEYKLGVAVSSFSPTQCTQFHHCKRCERIEEIAAVRYSRGHRPSPLLSIMGPGC